VQVASKSLTEAAVQQQLLLQCHFPNPCWCDVSSTARAWFVTIRMVATAAAALPAAWLSRLAGRRVATFTGVVLTLVGEQFSGALIWSLSALCTATFSSVVLIHYGEQ
jgi:MFS family permease